MRICGSTHPLKTVARLPQPANPFERSTSGSKRRFAVPARQSYTARDSMALASFSPSIPVCRERVVSVQRQEEPAACVFANQTKLLLPRFLAKSVAVGDEITFPIPARDAVGAEILVTKNDASAPSRYIYQAPIGYVSRPKQDKRNQSFVSAEVRRGGLGVAMVFLPCEVLREYFYSQPRTCLSSCVIWS